MTPAPDSSIHRHLDEAFAAVPLTPDAQDLKEELRSNMTARVADLLAQGLDEPSAVARAIAEVGDIGEAIGELGAGATTAAPTAAELAARNHLRPNPSFVLRAVGLSLLLTVAVILLVLGGVGLIDVTLLAQVGLALLGALSVGLLVFDGSHQETSSSFPLPVARAVGFGLAAAFGAFGIAALGIFVGRLDTTWLLFAGIPLVLASLMLFTRLGVTQTNRHKPWALELQRSYEMADRFSQDPAAAARFGMYTVIIWVLAFAGFIALSIIVGFVWSWLALVVGLVVFFLVLARMLFPADTAAATPKERE